MGKNSKKHKREYDKRVAESGLPPCHPTNEEIFAEYDYIGGIILTKKVKEKSQDKDTKDLKNKTSE
jgi:hypothetical protein